MKKRRFYSIGLLLLVVVFLLSLLGCDELEDILQTTYVLTVHVEGEGEVNYMGPYAFVQGTLVDLTVTAKKPWEFYAWTGQDREEVQEDNGIYKIKMDRDMEISAFFAKEFFDFVMEEHHFMGSGGEAFDLTDTPPYPPGFQIELLAIPTTEEDAFLHWSVSQGDPRDYFEDYEAKLTRYTIPDFPVLVTPYFTKRTIPTEPGEFDFDHNYFGVKKEGDVGLTEHYWDLGEVVSGGELDFFFHARDLPDRFRVFYGDWEEMELIFCSGWVSLNPSIYENPAIYPEGILLHDWHENVELSERILFGEHPGGGYEAMIRKEAGKDVLLIRVEGRDDGTKWDYIVDEKEE